MPLHSTKEVINGDAVERFNGNSPGKARPRIAPVRQEELRRGQVARTKAKARKRTQEDSYRRRYLGGA